MLADGLLALVREIDPSLALNYNKFYIGLARNGSPSNFVLFRPKKDSVRVDLKLERSDEVQGRLEHAGIELMEYDERGGRYRFRLAKGDTEKHKELLLELLRLSFEAFGK
jgi:hypothetical protein